MKDARHCTRTGCAVAATATLSYWYANRTVWIDDLALAPHPNGYDLCTMHADSLSVPVGWDRQDRRDPTGAMRSSFAVL
jgi:hypothetical protein